MDNLLSTKFLLTVLCVGLTFGLVIVDKASSDVFIQVVWAGLGIYGVANVAQKFAPVKK